MANKEEQIKEMLERFTPEQQEVFKGVAGMRLELATLQKQFVDLNKAYDQLWSILITITHAQPGQEIRIHESQFLRFRNEYRLDLKVEPSAVEGNEFVIKLLSLTDDLDSEQANGS